MRPQAKAKAAAFVLLVAVSEGFYSVSPFMFMLSGRRSLYGILLTVLPYQV